MTMTVHDIFYPVATLEEVESVGKVLFAFFRAELEHKIGRGTDDDVGEPDGIGTRLSFQVKLLDTLPDISF